MDFHLSEEQLSIQELAANFAREQFKDAADWDKTGHFPRQELRQAAELGFAGMTVNTDDGGSGLDRLTAALVFRELAKVCVSTAAYLSVHNMVAWLLSNYASSKLKQQFLTPMLTMDLLGSYCLTEPNAGSDAASLQTQAERCQEGFKLNGAKAFISGGGNSDFYCVMARTGEEGPKGISCFLVEKDRKGISFGDQEKKLGWHSQPTSMIFFDDCVIPEHHLIGELGQGFAIALSALNGGRINIAACSLGGANACLNFALDYSKTRRQFKQRIADFQHSQFALADMATDLDAATLLTFRAAQSLDSGEKDAISHCAMAKRFASDIAFRISDKALQLHGGYGYLQDYPVERFFRDLRVHQILEGTNEIMRVIIAKHLLREE